MHGATIKKKRLLVFRELTKESDTMLCISQTEQKLEICSPMAVFGVRVNGMQKR
jgi:hypothetical protein